MMIILLLQFLTQNIDSNKKINQNKEIINNELFSLFDLFNLCKLFIKIINVHLII